MATTTNVLITGPNRGSHPYHSPSNPNSIPLSANIPPGIGNGLLRAYLLLPNHTVIAGVRSPSSPQSLALHSLPKDPKTTLVIVHIDSEDNSTPAAAIAKLRSDHEIESLDVVIANAGICEYFGPVSSMPAAELTRHFQVNTIAPLSLFSAVLPLFRNPGSLSADGEKQSKFILISSAVGSLTLMEHIPFSTPAYGTKKLQTEMGNKGAEAAGKAEGEAEITLEESVSGLMGVIGRATREEMGGRLTNYDGKVLPW
ncbi:related to ketoreductase [Rhynchosporium agropyri]|uniref:Related to ketoreductase n=1 Tax=Rhynchosporium agropyri TaxID=914238 RepID=A0A1E1L4W7_9HELO|nr:related to ketoreductase [Rhynchosporium agropyri]